MQKESDATHTGVKAQPSPVLSSVRTQLLAFTEEQWLTLLRIICSYVQGLGLAVGDEVKPVAQEVLQEAIIEVLNYADRFDPSRQFMSWILGIALNVIRRKKATTTKRHHREIFLSQLAQAHTEMLNESDLLDQLLPSSQLETEQIVEAALPEACTNSWASNNHKSSLR